MRALVVGCCLWAFLMDAPPLVAEEGPLPTLTAEKADVERLGEEFKDERIRFRAPKDLQRVDRKLDLELTHRGFYSYAWTPGGAFPSIENVSVTLAPPARKSSNAIDEALEGMKESLRKGFEDVRFGESQKAMFRETEVRAGEFRAAFNGQKILAVYLLGIDKQGMFSLAAMMPEEKATEERVKLVQAALLTFQRAE